MSGVVEEGAARASRNPPRTVLVPGALALLPEYAGLQDPLEVLRAACRTAVAWLCEPGDQVTALGSEQGLRVARHLLEEAGGAHAPAGECASALLVVANGSARRTERAPGHLDPRAAEFDADLGRALTRPGPAALAGLDPALAGELWADVDALRRLGAEVLGGGEGVTVDYDDDPFGVQYWVVRWC